MRIATHQQMRKSVSLPTVQRYSGTSPYGHLTSKKTSPLQSPWLSPKLYSTVQITPCNKVTSALRSLLPSPVGDLNSEVPLYFEVHFCNCHAMVYTAGNLSLTSNMGYGASNLGKRLLTNRPTNKLASAFPQPVQCIFSSPCIYL